MVSDPRCPSCSGKVGMTAQWCMHCGAEFEEPLDAETGHAIDTSEDARGTETATGRGIDGEHTDTKPVAVVLAIVALIMVPPAAPSNTTVLHLMAVVGVAFYTNAQTTRNDAIQRGLRALAVSPLAIWMLSPVVVGFEAVSVVGVVPAAVYAGVVLWIRARIVADE